MTSHRCAFTGHRPHKLPWRYDESDERCVRLKQALATQIETMAQRGVTEFLSGMAQGTDTWAALAVLAFRDTTPALRLHCVLPWEGQADEWDKPARELYASILGQADMVTYVSREYREGCMLARNRFLVENASFLLAVYNGEWRGGTAATVRYAQKLGREIVILDPVTGRACDGRSKEQTSV